MTRRVFPDNTGLGNLFIDEVYQFYDIPLCFSSKNELGHRFLSTLIDLENPAEPRWFLLPISETRFGEVRSGALDLYSAFSAPELGFLYATSKRELLRILSSGIDKGLLPEKGIGLDIRSHTLGRPIASLQQYSDQTNREVIDISFDNERYKKTIYPIRLLSQNLRAVQDVINTIPIRKSSPSASKGRIAQHSLDETELGLTDLYAASFGTRLVSLSNTNVLFGETEIAKTLDVFLTLVELSVDEVQLRGLLADLSKRTVSKYLSLLKILSYNETNIKVARAIPRKEIRASFLPHKTAKTLVDLLTKLINDEPLEYEIEGTLVGLYANKKKFFISHEKDSKSEIMHGAVLDPNITREDYASINAHYIFKIRELESFNPVTDETKYEYFLLEMRKSNI